MGANMLLAPTTTTFWPAIGRARARALRDAIGRAGREHGVAVDEPADVYRWKPSHPWRGNALEHVRHRDLRRQRQLHEDTVHVRALFSESMRASSLDSGVLAGLWYSSEWMRRRRMR